MTTQEQALHGTITDMFGLSPEWAADHLIVSMPFASTPKETAAPQPSAPAPAPQPKREPVVTTRTEQHDGYEVTITEEDGRMTRASAVMKGLEGERNVTRFNGSEVCDLVSEAWHGNDWTPSRAGFDLINTLGYHGTLGHYKTETRGMAAFHRRARKVVDCARKGLIRSAKR